MLNDRIPPRRTHFYTRTGILAALVAVGLAVAADDPTPIPVHKLKHPLVQSGAAPLKDLHREQPGSDSIPVPQRLLGQRITTPAQIWHRGSFASVQVNVDNMGNNIVGDAANEPSIAVDPNDPDRIVVGWRQFNSVLSNFRESGWAHSHDGGADWTFPGSIRPGEFASDPVLSVDNNGNFYYYSLQPNRGPGSWACYMYKSFDGGVTWPQDVYANGGDRQWFTIDRSAAGPGRLYAYWNSQFSCCAGDLTRSFNGGTVFQTPTALAPPKMKWGTITAGPEGHLYIAGSTLSQTGHVFGRSQNARFSLQTPVFDILKEVDLGGTTGAGGLPNPGGLLGQVWIDVDRSGTNSDGTIYILGSVTPPGSDPLDIHLIRSADLGQTWSAPVRVNDDTPGTKSVFKKGVGRCWVMSKDDAVGVRRSRMALGVQWQ